MSKIKKIFKKALNISEALFIISDIRKFTKNNDERFKIKIKNLMPRLNDKTSETNFDLHYIFHPAWAARIIAKTKPEKHIDISSTLHFSTLLSAFVPTEFYDYRPANITLDNFTSNEADLNNLHFPSGSIASLSCMHTIEHIGLGRYGDKIDPRGDLRAIEELKRVLAKAGTLLFVVPVGRPRIVFNAHRIYSYEQILSYFSDLELKEFTLISEKNKKMIINADPSLVKEENYGCGCFWFTKK
jgi:SAM-dependent methyltransferase